MEMWRAMQILWWDKIQNILYKMGENVKSHANVLQKLVDQTKEKSFQSIQGFPILLKLSWLNFSFLK